MAVADIDLTDRIARLERKYRFAVVTAGVGALCAVVGLAGNMADRAVAAPPRLEARPSRMCSACGN
ncbi:hypothetical protein MOP88_09345 [Sphingomonas sp. WKB10]|nr:hypothetical protein [Sphingomonas sp. WKB10]